MSVPLLHHGQFFGLPDCIRDVAGFSLSIRRADPSIRVERHTHEDAHFILLLDGHYLSSARGAGHLWAEPGLIFNPPGTTHRDAFPDRTGRFLGISVSPERFSEACELGRPIDEPLRIWNPAALRLAQHIAQLVVREPSDLALEASCLALVAASVRGRRDEVRPPRWLRSAREELHDRAREQVTIGAVARQVGVHPVHLARTFRRFFGCSPAAYARRVRVERAARRVRATTASLAEIAVDCGFVDQSHMTRAFARTLGVTPAAYRRRV